ncbi:MAG: hypothetical protein ACD_77C00296G0011 [uncultured bacterium]|nr:MAG: hypothetical protein ACD_77C00296G0011 [uncultured bacterium]HBY01554.1 hypothetical protein [Rikenellaceae bacterium]
MKYNFSKQISIELLLWGLFFLLSACNGGQQKQKDTLPKPPITEATGYIVPKDSMIPPTIVPAGKPIVVKTGNLKETSVVSALLSASAPKKIIIHSPVKREMSTNGFTKPNVIKTVEDSILCKDPEQVIVKDPFFKDKNPSNFFYFGRFQGLKHDQVRCMIQDKSGNLWLGTDIGLTKYDGKYFYHYTTKQGLNNNTIYSLFQDSKGNIWFGTFNGGVTRYDGSYLVTFTDKDGLPGNIVNCIFEDNSGNIWIGTKKGLSMYDGKSFTNYTFKQGLAANEVRSIIQDASGKLWFATYGGGISVFDGKSFYSYSIKEGLPLNHVSSLFRDVEGNIWINTAYEGIIKYDGTDFYQYTTKEGLGSNSIRSILQDEQKNLWFGNANGSITKFDGKSFRQYGINDGLEAEAIRCSLQDNNGNIWFGTRGAGLIRFDGRLFSQLTGFEVLGKNRIESITEDKAGNMWFGTFGEYVTVYSEQEKGGVLKPIFQKFGNREGLGSRYVFGMTTDKNGRIWFATDDGGISVYDGVKTITYKKEQGLKSNSASTVFCDKTGNIWLATSFLGVTKFDGKDFTEYSKQQGVSSNHVKSIFQDSKDNMWFGTAGGGATKFDGENYTHFNKSSGFYSDTVNCIVEDRLGNIWLGTNGEGIVRYDGKTFIRYMDESGLKNNYVVSMLIDSRGNLWAGSYSYLHFIKSKNLEKIDTANSEVFITSFGIEDGFSGTRCNTGALKEDKKGTIWIGTYDRLIAYNGENRTEKIVPPNLKIINVRLFNENVPWKAISVNRDTSVTLQNGATINKLHFKGLSKWYNVPVDLALKHNQNYITFCYIGITHTQMHNVKYLHMLEGRDKGWSSPSDKTEISYDNLNPGKYVFKVKAVSGEGESSNEVRYSFLVNPPWWKTWWFYVLITVFAAFLLYSFIKLRERKLKQDRELLQKKVDDQTFELTDKNGELQKLNLEKDKLFSIISHDLRGPFSSFMALTSLMAEENDSFTKEEIKEFTISLNCSASSLYRLLDNLLQWSRVQQGSIPFNPKTINLKSVALEATELIKQNAEEKNIEFVIDIPEEILVNADNNMLQSIIRNLVSNAIKFTSQGGRVTLSAGIKAEDKIEIIVEDNGIGMSKEMMESLFYLNVETGRTGTDGEPSTGLGLIICKEFIEKHNGTLSIESEIKKGSRFIITL